MRAITIQNGLVIRTRMPFPRKEDAKKFGALLAVLKAAG